MIESDFKNPSCSSINKQELLTKIETSLNRMKSRGHENTEGYSRLLNKYIAIKLGADFVLHDVTESTLKQVGSLIVNISRNYRLTPFDQ